MANYAVLKAAINAVIKTNGNKEITGQVLNQTLMAIVNSLGENYQFAGVAVPGTNPGTPDQNIFYLATQAGTYTNFGAIVLPAGISMLEWKNNTWSSETFFTIDDAPTSGSDNLIKSGAVFDAFKNDGGAYDVSVHFPTGGVEGGNTYTLDGAVTMVPQNMRKGGMSIKFVSSSDNKYVQFRYMSSSTAAADFTNMANWQGVDEEPTIDSQNLPTSGGVFNSVVNVLGEKAINTNHLIKNHYLWSQIPGENDFQLSTTSTTDALITPIYFDRITNIEVRKADGTLQNTKFKVVYDNNSGVDTIIGTSLSKYRGKAYNIIKCYLYWVNTQGDTCYCNSPEELNIVLYCKDRVINVGIRDMNSLNVGYSGKDTDGAVTTLTYNNNASLVFSDNFGCKFNFTLSSNSFTIQHNKKLIHNFISNVTEVKPVDYICSDYEITLTKCYTGYLYGGVLPISDYYLNRGDLDFLYNRLSITKYEWEQGLWDASGNPIDKTTRIRFPFLLKTNKVDVKKIPQGNIYVCWYDSNKTYLGVTQTSYARVLSRNNAVYARIGYGKDDSTEITPSVLQDIDLNVYSSFEPASEYYSKIIGLVKDYSKYLTWEQGSWDTQGIPDTRNDKIRTPLIKGNWFNLLKKADGITRYVVCWYDNNKTFLSYATASQGYNFNNSASYFRFAMGNDGQSIEPAFAVTSNLEILCENIQDEYLRRNYDKVEKLYGEPGIDKYLHVKDIPYCVVNDKFSETSGSASHLQIDEVTGICFVSYLTSHTEYGETRGLSGLSVFPASQPFKAENYVFAKTGDLDYNGVPLDGQPFETNCLVYRNANNKLKCRCFFNCGNQKLYYRDFDYETRTFDFAAKIVQYDGADMTRDAMSLIVQNAGYDAWGISNGIIFTSNLYKNYSDDYIYACIEGTTGNPIVIKSNDNFASCVFVGILPEKVWYECQICELNGTFYIMYRQPNITMQTTTDFVNFSTKVTLSTCDQRPQCLSYNDEIWLFIPNKVSYNGNRQCYEIYKGIGTDIATYTKVATLEDEFGVVYISGCFLNGRLTVSFSSSPFMFTSNQGKDDVAFYVLPNVYEGTKPISIN